MSKSQCVSKPQSPMRYWEYRNSDISEPWPESTSPQPGSDRAKMRGSKT